MREADIKDLLALLDESPVGVSISRRRDGVIVYANRRFTDLVGATPQDFIGTKARAHFVNETQRLSVVEHLKAHGSLDHHDVEFKRADGTPFWTSLNIRSATFYGEPVNLAWIYDITGRKQSERSLAESQSLMRALIDVSADGIILFAPDGTLLTVNSIAARALGGTPHALAGANLWNVMPRGILSQVRGAVATVYSEARAGHYHHQHRGRFFDNRIYPIANAEGHVDKLAVFVRDITEARESEAQLRKLSAAVEQSSVTIMITSAAGAIEYVNQAFTEVTGFTAAEVIGKNPRLLQSGLVADVTYQELWKTITAGGTWQGELCNKKKDGTLYWEFATISPVKDGDGRIANFLAVKENITLRKEYEVRLLHQETHDPLTGLPNRTLAMDRLEHAIAAAARGEKMVVAMLAVLDDLNKINDTLGYQGGDTVIVEFCRRILSAVRDADTVARVGGNEFLVIVSNVDSPTLAETMARRILDECRRGFQVENQEVFLTARIGMTAYPTDGTDPFLLVRNAHAATVRSDERGGNSIRFFTPAMDADSQRRLRIESSLQRAIERNELKLHYQPIVAADGRRIVGAEALLRWRHPEMGAVPPDQFIPVAEASDLILPLSEWVLATACRDARPWLRHHPEFRLAVNFSPRQFKRRDLIDSICGTLAELDFPADRLEVEVTERLMMGRTGNAKGHLDAMRQRNISISIDDFGTGYSALSYLQHHVFDTIKIDRSFVSNIGASHGTRSLVAAIIEMARAMRMKVIAEGVETAAQASMLAEMGCGMMQGFLLGRPMPAESFSSLLSV